jgi:tRNA (guanine-N7-)-methyltransferase
MNVQHPRRIRSFVRRPGRITTGQKHALETLLPRFGVPFSNTAIDLDAVFGRTAARVLDIGFGAGEALVSTAAAHPHIDYLGIEVHAPGIGHLLAQIERAGLGNIRVIDHDAVEVLESMLPDASFDALNLFFPDPGPKKRHHKRRIVQAPFLRNVARVLTSRGLLHFATDWADYAEKAQEIIASTGLFETCDAAAVAGDPLAFRAPTKFEARGRRLGHDVVDVYYSKRDPAARP